MIKPVFCKRCGTKKVRWDGYFDEKGFKRWLLVDLATGDKHTKYCKKKPSVISHIIYQKK